MLALLISVNVVCSPCASPHLSCVCEVNRALWNITLAHLIWPLHHSLTTLLKYTLTEMDANKKNSIFIMQITM